MRKYISRTFLLKTANRSTLCLLLAIWTLHHCKFLYLFHTVESYLLGLLYTKYMTESIYWNLILVYGVYLA